MKYLLGGSLCHSRLPDLSSVTEAATLVGADFKFGETDDELLLLLQMLTTLQTSCWMHNFPLVVVGFVGAAVVVVARIVVVFQAFVVVS